MGRGRRRSHALEAGPRCSPERSSPHSAFPIAILALAASSVLAGMLVVGRQPLVDLSGALLEPQHAIASVSLAWISVLPPAFGFTALAVLISVATRSSAAGIGLPVVAGLAMQLYAYVDGAEKVRRLLIASAFNAWHGLLNDIRTIGR